MMMTSHPLYICATMRASASSAKGWPGLMPRGMARELNCNLYWCIKYSNRQYINVEIVSKLLYKLQTRSTAAAARFFFFSIVNNTSTSISHRRQQTIHFVHAVGLFCLHSASDKDRGRLRTWIRLASASSADIWASTSVICPTLASAAAGLFRVPFSMAGFWCCQLQAVSAPGLLPATVDGVGPLQWELTGA